MSKSIKLKNNTYIDSTGIVHNRTLLSTLLDTLIPKVNKNTSDIEKLQDRVLIFDGSAGSGTNITINTTWEQLGRFKDLIVQVKYTGWNDITNCRFNYDDLSTGDNLYSGKRNSNVYSSIGLAGGNNISLHIVPAMTVTTNTIKFDNYNATITRIWVEY